MLGLHLAVGEMKMCEQWLNPLVSEFPWQPSEGRVPLQKRVAYFQLTKGKEVLTVILLMETSDKFPQPFRCHMELGMLVFNQKGKYYQIDLLGIHQAPTPPARDGKFPLFQNSGFSAETGGLLNRRMNCGFFGLLTKNMGAINHHVKYFENRSSCEEAEIIIIHICSPKEQLSLWKLAIMQLKELRTILP